MSGSLEWGKSSEQKVIKYIRGTPTEIYNAYMKAVDAVFDVADTFSQHGISSCSTGILIPVEGQDAALRCAVFGHQREIHIFDIKP